MLGLTTKQNEQAAEKAVKVETDAFRQADADAGQLVRHVAETDSKDHAADG